MALLIKWWKFSQRILMQFPPLSPTSSSQSQESTDTNTENDKLSQPPSTGSEPKGKEVHELYTAEKNRITPQWILPKQPEKKKTEAASKINLLDLPREILIHVYKYVLPGKNPAQNTRALLHSRLTCRRLRGLLEINDFDFLRNQVSYRRTQKKWNTFFPALKKKKSKPYSSDEVKALQELWVDAVFIEESQILEWLTFLEGKMQRANSSRRTDLHAAHNTSVLIQASGVGILLRLKSLREEDRTRVFNLLIGCTPAQLLQIVENIWKIQPSMNQLITFSPEQYGQIFNRIHSEYPLRAMWLLAPAFNRLSEQSQARFLGTAHVDPRAMPYACRTFLLQSEEQQKSTLEALEKMLSPASSKLKEDCMRQFLKPADGSSSAQTIFSRIPEEMQQKLTKLLPSLASHLPQTPP